ncbi:MAG: hypothetical protein HQL54_02350 [Magnetococcales bacterium]|nr:hypothetical protein [Magnetococcales bacterium]
MNTDKTVTWILSDSSCSSVKDRLYESVFSDFQRINIFLVYRGVYLSGALTSFDIPGERFACGLSARQFEKPASAFSLGGLANLGNMIRHSQWIAINDAPPVAFPHSETTSAGVQKLTLLVNDPTDHPRTTESIRIAIGLAGCGHTVALSGRTFAESTLNPEEFQNDAREYLSYLDALGVRIAPDPSYLENSTTLPL